jgi:hypothetical protein
VRRVPFAGRAEAAPELAVAHAALEAGFDHQAYRDANPDLAELGAVQLARHFDQWGRAEGRRAVFALAPDAARARILAAGLAEADARRLVADVEQAAASRDDAAADHAFAEAALAAGFDDQAYLRNNPDLAGLDRFALSLHYHQWGRRERRRAAFTRRPEAVASEDGAPRLSEADRALLREDVLAASLRGLDRFGGDPAGFEALFRATQEYRRAVVISDSHGHFYLSEDVLRDGRVAALPFLCTGGSARGLINPVSRAGYGERILGFLGGWGERLADTIVLFKFGQVDLEFVHDFRRLRDGRMAFVAADAVAFAEQTAARYLEFLQRAQAATPGRLVVTAALPPALNDATVRAGYVDAHIVSLHGETAAAQLAHDLAGMEMPDQRARTDLARAFNAALEAGCRRAGLTFFDDFTPLLGPGGVIDPAYTAPHGGSDHHLAFDSAACGQAAARSVRELTARL